MRISDWSSDVCSSDLRAAPRAGLPRRPPMPRHFVFTLLAALGLAGVAHAAPPPKAVAIDPERYAGKWYEIAGLPTPLQRRCVGDATVEYTVAPHGGLHINNRCRTKNGDIAAMSGLAVPREGAAGAQDQI